MFEETIQDDIKIVMFKNGKTNPINKEMLLQLKEIIDEVNAHPIPKGLILTGDGRFFSSGFDLPIFINFKELKEATDFFDMEEEVLLALFTCEKPVVSAMNGHCAAAGLIYSMAADYRIVKDHPKIKIGMSEIKIGLPLTIAQDEVMRFGFDSNRKFRDVMFFGEMMDVYKAKELKLVDEVVAEDQLIDRAKQVITQWIDTPNRPFIRMKQLLRMDTARRIQKKLKEENWHEGLNCFFREDVRQTLEFVQASMA
ncbi:MAG: enoyl-CoA hydratase/isomerase family protein [Desulfobacteraceae bacterium]|nr:enoyl-CoA hydratase/isomerase family protein [Desulfobacteraceae bacterium]MBC2757046.1 enoyl-CoA hydratase/isomerase family protein [Desulfobacteraceae bacterium]